MSAEKQAIRKQIKHLRAKIGQDKASELNSRIIANAIMTLKNYKDQIVSCYWGSSKLGEINTKPILQYLLDHDYRLCMPSMEGKGYMRMLEVKCLQELKEAKYGIYEPDKHAKELQPNLVITPLMGVDADGYRVGYGGGYFDRYFSKQVQAIRVGLVYEMFIFDKLPHDEYDVPINAVITEDRYLEFNLD
jgi:5-formyltetrahydrofolate cyclo-ligase